MGSVERRSSTEEAATLDYICQKFLEIKHKQPLSLKECCLKSVYKQVKGKPISELNIPNTLKFEIADVQRSEFLLLWEEIYESTGFIYLNVINKVYSLIKKGPIYLDCNELSPSIRDLLFNNKEYEVLKKLTNYILKYYKPKCLDSIYWQNFYELYTDEELQFSEEDSE